jgi:hypothetical protein
VISGRKNAKIRVAMLIGKAFHRSRKDGIMLSGAPKCLIGAFWFPFIQQVELS